MIDKDVGRACPADLATPSAEPSAAHLAEQFCDEGIPLDLTATASAHYVECCQSFIDALSPFDSLLIVKLRTAQLVAASALRSAQCDLDSAADAATEVQSIAERTGDATAQAYALAAWAMTRPAPEHTEARVRAANRILDIATVHDARSLIPVGYALLLNGLLEQGQIRLLDIKLLEQRTTVARLILDPQSNPVLWFRTLRLILDGDTTAAERHATELFEYSNHDGTTAHALFITQMGMIRWMQGRIENAEETFLLARREYPEQLLWPVSLVWLWLLQGRRDSAEALLASLPPLSEIPHDKYWLSTVVGFAEIARLTGSRENAQRLRELLLPFAAHLIPAGVGVSFWGTVARTLGLLEEHLGLYGAALEHLKLAVEVTARIGALAWHAEAQIELAEFAIRHEILDVSAYELLAEAKATCDSRGFPALSQRAMHRSRIRVLGGFEVVSFCGVRAEWSSRKARELLKMLVAAQGVATSREVFMDVLWPDEPPRSLANRFSVAIHTIRRALDPERQLPTQHHLVTEGDAIRLNIDNLNIDLERFLTLARRPDALSQGAALQIYRGPAFSDEPYADWASEVRSHAAHLHKLIS